MAESINWAELVASHGAAVIEAQLALAALQAVVELLAPANPRASRGFKGLLTFP